MPSTELASRFLFSEAIPEGRRIQVVLRNDDLKERERIEAEYRNLFWAEPEFEFEDAKDWISKMISNARGSSFGQ